MSSSILPIILILAAVLAIANGQQYDTVSGAWISGDKTTDNLPVYGTQFVASQSNTPGSRYHHCMVSRQNTIIIFGGSSAAGRHNDLFRFDIGTSLWTWLSGSNTTGSVESYVTLGVESSLNQPGAANYASCFMDTSTDTLWKFGGISSCKLINLLLL
jgi:hypothetical protein